MPEQLSAVCMIKARRRLSQPRMDKYACTQRLNETRHRCISYGMIHRPICMHACVCACTHIHPHTDRLKSNVCYIHTLSLTKLTPWQSGLCFVMTTPSTTNVIPPITHLTSCHQLPSVSLSISDLHAGEWETRGHSGAHERPGESPLSRRGALLCMESRCQCLL